MVVANKHIKRMGSPEKIYQRLIQFKKDVQLLSQKRAELTKEYPNKWLAFYNGEVVATTDTLAELIEKIEKSGLPRELVVTQFLGTEKLVMIL